MTAPETWRVVLESGEVREVSLARSHMVGAPWVPNGDGLCGAADPRIAVAAYAGARALPAREILAPGEATRAEAAERARRDGVLHGLTIAHDHAVALIDGSTGLPIIDWTDVTVATGDALARPA